MSVRAITRIGLIGDVHAEDTLLERALDHLAGMATPPEAILCTGDVADGAGSIGRACDLLARFGVATVRGNHDRWLLDDVYRHVPQAHLRAELDREALAFIDALPVTREFETAGGRLLLCHGVGTDDLAKVWPGSPRMAPERSVRLDALIGAGRHAFLVNGHMHYRTVVRFPGMTLINAGTLRRDHRPGCMLIDFVQGTIQSFEVQDDGVRPLVTLDLGGAGPIWTDSAAFDGNWNPPALY